MASQEQPILSFSSIEVEIYFLFNAYLSLKGNTEVVG
jgi:hypothetical protein